MGFFFFFSFWLRLFVFLSFLHVCNKDIYFYLFFSFGKNKFKLLFLVVVLPSIAREVQSTSPKAPPQNACTEV